MAKKWAFRESPFRQLTNQLPMVSVSQKLDSAIRNVPWITTSIFHLSKISEITELLSVCHASGAETCLKRTQGPRVKVLKLPEKSRPRCSNTEELCCNGVQVSSPCTRTHSKYSWWTIFVSLFSLSSERLRFHIRDFLCSLVKGIAWHAKRKL